MLVMPQGGQQEGLAPLAPARELCASKQYMPGDACYPLSLVSAMESARALQHVPYTIHVLGCSTDCLAATAC